MSDDPWKPIQPPEHWRIIYFAAINSTNRYILDQISLGAREGLAVVADFQREGRGRLDRRWSAPPGASILASILVEPKIPVEELHLVGKIIALAMSDAIMAYSDRKVDLKWPNDLMVSDAKLGGILIEMTRRGSQNLLVCGTGINLSWTDEDLSRLGRPATSIFPSDRSYVREGMEIFFAYLDGVWRRLVDLRSAKEGPVWLIEEYTSRCRTIGRKVEVDLGHERFSGKAVGLGPRGELLVEHGGSLKSVTVGDVVHLFESNH